MAVSPFLKRSIIGSLVALTVLALPVRADSVQEKFYRAYYLEHTERDWAAAAKLYEEVVESRRVDDELRAKAKHRLAACREELTAGNLARLMPADTWAYVELRRPGDQVGKLLKKLGLIAEPGDLVKEGERRVAVSPVLIREALGMGGVAAAITGFNPVKGEPYGVLVFHPGDVEVIRGLLETGLPVGGKAVEPIAGFATYDVEGEALVTLTSRLVIVSPQRALIEGVVDRLTGKSKSSLATNDAVAELVRPKDDSLVWFFVNAKSMMPVLTGLMAAGSMADREMAMVQSLIDLESLHSLSGRFGVDDDGISLEVALRLDEGHHNLVYNFLRTPAINPETIKSVPSGAAGFVVAALNEAESRYKSGPIRRSGNQPVITALDFGREIFANITSFAIFVLPPDENAERTGPPIPDVAAVISVNDPAKSEALWTQLLTVGSFAAGAPAMQGDDVEIAGIGAQRYKLPDGISIYLATVEDTVIIASSEHAMSGAVRAKRKGKSVLDDPAFGPTLSEISADTTKAVFVHAGRSARIARGFMSESERAEAAPIMDALSDTVGSFVVQHSNEVFRLSAKVTGIPDIGDLVAELVTEEARKEDDRSRLTRAMRSGDWDSALSQVEAQLEADPTDVKLLRSKFKILAVGKKDREAALTCAKRIFEASRDDAAALNRFAWALLTEDPDGDDYAKVALMLSERSNELTDHENWMFLDTLALAKFKTGDAVAAVELEKKALQACGDCWGKEDVKEALDRFERAAADAKVAGTRPSP